jgi:inner membrane protein
VKWINHIAIAGATCAVWKPELVALAVAGSTAPDWLEWVLKAVGRRVSHRSVTHYVIYWVLGIAFGLFAWDFHYAITAFSIGGLSHVMADACTLMGVPLGWWSDRKFHIFGGRLRTGGMGEYWVAGAVVLFWHCNGNAELG